MLDRRQFARSVAGVSALPLASAIAFSQDADNSDSRNSGSVASLNERLNPKIQASREIAIAALMPSVAEMDRGLKLHAESIVFDSYGFGPRAAIDGAALADAVEAGASAAELKDLREDMTMTRFVIDPVEQQEFRDAWRASGVTCVFNNAGEEGQDPMRLIKRLARHTYVTSSAIRVRLGFRFSVGYNLSFLYSIWSRAMPRPPRVEFPGAIYHLISRGDGRR